MAKDGTKTGRTRHSRQIIFASRETFSWKVRCIFANFILKIILLSSSFHCIAFLSPSLLPILSLYLSHFLLFLSLTLFLFFNLSFLFSFSLLLSFSLFFTFYPIFYLFSVLALSPESFLPSFGLAIIIFVQTPLGRFPCSFLPNFSNLYICMFVMIMRKT